MVYKKLQDQGEMVAVVMSKQEYDKLVQPKATLVEFFEKSPLSEIDIEIERSKEAMRDFDL